MRNRNPRIFTAEWSYWRFPLIKRLMDRHAMAQEGFTWEDIVKVNEAMKARITGEETTMIGTGKKKLGLSTLSEIKTYLNGRRMAAENSANLEEHFGRDRVGLDAEASAFKDAVEALGRIT